MDANHASEIENIVDASHTVRLDSSVKGLVSGRVGEGASSRQGKNMAPLGNPEKIQDTMFKFQVSGVGGRGSGSRAWYLLESEEHLVVTAHRLRLPRNHRKKLL
jgi:hypothetical protein